MDKKIICDAFHIRDASSLSEQDVKRIEDAVRLKNAQTDKQVRRKKRTKTKFCVIIEKDDRR